MDRYYADHVSKNLEEDLRIIYLEILKTPTGPCREKLTEVTIHLREAKKALNEAIVLASTRLSDLLKGNSDVR